MKTLHFTSTQFQKHLLNWFDKHKRDLPWRSCATPYHIFVVEVMLQQTQIKTVLPYYERWFKAFPDIKNLAGAPLDQVLKLWEGLGYYSRARNLYKASQIIVEKFGGKVPDTIEALQTLPGIGRYTAGAIASIAYQKSVSLVDGNVMRVLARIFNLRDDISKPETIKKFYGLADRLVSLKRPGEFNQALMELGSLICVPEFPECHSCPVSKFCLSFLKGDPSKLPVRSKGPEIKKIKMAVGLLKQDGKILIRRRPERGIWGGLWEIPGTVCLKGERPEEAIVREFKEILGIPVQIIETEKPVSHRFTHRDATILPFRLKMKQASGAFKKIPARWSAPSHLDQFSFPVPHQKILRTFALSKT